MKTDLGLTLKRKFWSGLGIKQDLEDLSGGSSTPPQWGGGSLRAFRRALDHGAGVVWMSYCRDSSARWFWLGDPIRAQTQTRRVLDTMLAPFWHPNELQK